MSRRPARATQAEISRATKVAKAQGMAVEIDQDGTIRIVPVRGSVLDAAEKALFEPNRRIVF